MVSCLKLALSFTKKKWSYSTANQEKQFHTFPICCFRTWRNTGYLSSHQNAGLSTNSCLYVYRIPLKSKVLVSRVLVWDVMIRGFIIQYFTSCRTNILLAYCLAFYFSISLLNLHQFMTKFGENLTPVDMNMYFYMYES